MRVTFRTLILMLALTLSSGVATAGVEYLYAVDNFSTQLYRIDGATGATIDNIPVTLAGGGSINSIKGLASDPSTGELYVILRASDPGEGQFDDFRLASIAPDTGIATVIGTLPDRFAGLAFAPPPIGPTPTPPPVASPDSSSGGSSRTKGGPALALYGVTGDGAATPSSLFIIDTTTALTTFVTTFGTPSDGETIAYNPVDGLLYHLSGFSFGAPTNTPEGDDGRVFESLNLTTMVRTPIPLSGDFFGNGNGLTYDGSGGQFLVSTRDGQPDANGPGIGNALFAILADGTATFLGPTATFFTGTAFSELVPVEIMSFTIE